MILLRVIFTGASGDVVSEHSLLAGNMFNMQKVKGPAQ